MGFPKRTTDGAFHPPYVLGGPVFLVLGVLRDPPNVPPSADLAGWSPVRLCGGTMAVVLASRYDEPPAQQPIRYDEVIVGVVLRRGFHLATLPLSMNVSEEIPVVEGQEHYSLPKIYDPRTKVSIADGGAVSITGAGVCVEALPLVAWRRWISCLPCWVAAIGMRAFTALVRDLGVAREPHRWVIVALRPAGAGWPLAVKIAQLPEGPFRPLWAQAFKHGRTWLGPPHDLGARSSSHAHHAKHAKEEEHNGR